MKNEIHRGVYIEKSSERFGFWGSGASWVLVFQLERERTRVTEMGLMTESGSHKRKMIINAKCIMAIMFWVQISGEFMVENKL